ncbi:dihydroorotate dehydrogenase electron transfer subunit [Ornithinibacillus halotolerans]|uniref:Dihydroorotate dehydrogenase B (NAD(+)), electron transfer subunit n=1 Tax=Ornithinibacillus halotolerans TaxID=1274357 RepID=A0A916S597_9BACI|nr:dihydroorotate dehydrogenase electron transfer subunit [Ornithinibacillus halotolerans]GGA84087.1 dihydroorotate dehydrogenase B (NAD(+)), electron transfer subunit [Ornithinibacillus halotolerans]
MMKREKMRIVSTRVIAKETIEMVLENKWISTHASPGQFLHIQIGSHTLRRPISIADCNHVTNEITILFKITGDGTRHLGEYQVGNYLDVLGPIGNGFPTNITAQSTVLLVGGGIGVPPLYFLGKFLKENGINIKAVLGFQGEDHVFYEPNFRELGETIIVTNDGSYGEKGYVTDVLENNLAFDYYYSCGPTPMLRSLISVLKGKKGYISLEERMGCGVGACLACILPAKNERGYKKICSDGPVFNVEEVTI